VKKLGILKTDALKQDFVDQFGEYPDMFARRMDAVGAPLALVTYDVQKGEYPESIDEVDAYLITGSKASVYDDEHWIAPLMDFVRALHAAKKKLVGICFGHQILAQALGGKVEKFSGGWSVGATEYDFKPLHACGSLMAWHQDQVVELPPKTSVVGSSNFCRYAMLDYDGRALSLQPHPEFDTEFVKDLLNARKADLPVDIVEHANQHMDRELSREEIADVFERFLKGLAE